MKSLFTIGWIVGLAFLLIACSGGGGSVGVYHHHHGPGFWWGGGGYIRDRVIVIPDSDLDVEATPLPSGPEMMPMPDMGMPDMGDFGGDLGGDW